MVIGPSGSGKSSYCCILKEMNEILKRNVHVINLDPAAEFLPYQPTIDIRELITLKDVMEEYKLGPNGGLVYCLEYLLDNMDWFEEQLSMLSSEDYILIDCPGQLELYSHGQPLAVLAEKLYKGGISLCAISLLDSTFLQDEFKMISGILMALTFIVSLGLPHICVLSKCDLVADKTFLQKKINRYTEGDIIDFDLEPIEKPEESVFGQKNKQLLSAFDSVVS